MKQMISRSLVNHVPTDTCCIANLCNFNNIGPQAEQIRLEECRHKHTSRCTLHNFIPDAGKREPIHLDDAGIDIDFKTASTIATSIVHSKLD